MATSRGPDYAEGAYKAYEDYAKTLRTWLVAFGAGVPALIIGNATLWSTLDRAGALTHIGAIFLAGASLQIILAFINKIINWVNYTSELEGIPDAKRIGYKKLCHNMGDYFIIDVMFDVITIALFMYGAGAVFYSLAAATPVPL
jgi:hypothetical protein